MNRIFFILLFLSGMLPFFHAQAQSGGNSTSGTPPHMASLLHVDAGTDSARGLLVTGAAHAEVSVPDLGSGSRLMFYPGKVALGWLTYTYACCRSYTNSE